MGQFSSWLFWECLEIPVVAYADLCRVADKINQTARVEINGEVLEISAEMRNVAFLSIPKRERSRTPEERKEEKRQKLERKTKLQERQEEKRQELENIKTSLDATIMQKTVDYQARTQVEEATGMPVTTLYNYLAEHFDLARFEIDGILANNAHRVAYPSETAIYVKPIAE